MCGVTHNKSFGLGLTATEVHKHIFYMTYGINFSSTNSCTIQCMMFIFHILDNFCILEIFHILDFYISFYTFLYQAFHIMDNFHIL